MINISISLIRTVCVCVWRGCRCCCGVMCFCVCVRPRALRWAGFIVCGGGDGCVVWCVRSLRVDAAAACDERGCGVRRWLFEREQRQLLSLLLLCGVERESERHGERGLSCVTQGALSMCRAMDVKDRLCSRFACGVGRRLRESNGDGAPRRAVRHLKLSICITSLSVRK